MMPRTRTLCALRVAIVGGISLLAVAGCADRAAVLQREVTELRRKLEAARHERDEAKGKVEELQNQVMILEDRLAAQVAPAKDDAKRPQVVVVRPAPVREEPRRDVVTVDPDDPDIEYDGPARDTRSPRPVLRIDGPYARRGAPETEVAPTEPRPARQGRRPVGPWGTLPVASDERLPVVPLPDAGVPARPAPGGTAKAPPPAAAPGAPKASPTALYQKALDALRTKDHAGAIAGFRDLVRAHPRHPLADNAQYWTGEAYYDQKDYAAALAEFKKVVREHPSGNKAPDALLKAGYCHLKLGDQKSARNLLGQVVELYPKSAAAKLAAERLRDLR